MAIEPRRHDRTLVIWTGSRFDGVNAHTFHDRLDATISVGERAVVIDMEELTYISNVGLRVMLQTIRKMQERPARLARCSLSEDVRAAFETSGFDRLVEIHPSQDGAIAAVIDWRTVAHGAAVEDENDNYRCPGPERQKD